MHGTGDIRDREGNGPDAFQFGCNNRIPATKRPWAWGINDYASVVGAVLASILAMHIGLTLVVCLALELYAVAALALTIGTPQLLEET